ncbi:MAG: arsenosugar biosynthesis radical SAM protein ArsS [Planctomycetes bacterium]|nr:arsenosugar biosynthesis radical SAM protein ArsS [Planctomycetota bacterium]
MVELTLMRRKSPLANAVEQLRILDNAAELPGFEDTLSEHGLRPLTGHGIEVLQVNVGKLCNQTCRHCHVDAGPDRRESMSRETAEAVVRVLAATDIPTLDITGGAPEMNPNFRWLVEQARRLDRHVIDRCNLTILLAPGFQDLPEFLAQHEVEIVASLPCYLEANCDRQRGDGVFRRSIEALKRLNELGYARPDGELDLTLVYNPVGPSLPPPQAKLESDYRLELRARYGVEFTRLYTITNMPISRFLDDLLRSGKYDEYMQKLVRAFNPAAVDGVMCRTMISVDWQGRLYDCDFNQMLELPVTAEAPQTIHDFNLKRLADRKIVTGRHCYGCTAGWGSGCQGSVLG